MLRNAVDGWNWVSYAAGAATPIIGYLVLSKYSDWQTNRELRREEAEREYKREMRNADNYVRRVTNIPPEAYASRMDRPSQPAYRAPVTPAREVPKPPVTSPRPVTQPKEPYRPPVTPAREAPRPAVTPARETPRPQLPSTSRKPETPALPVNPIEAARKRQRELGDGNNPKELGSGR